MDYTSKKKKWLLSIVALLIGLFHLIPFYILLTTAFKERGDFSSKWVLPETYSFENFTQAWETANLGTAFINTVIITFFSALLLILFSSMAAYPLARFKTRLNNFVYMLLVAVMVIPPLTALVPLYQLVVDLGMMNTHAIAILNNVAAYTPLAVFLYTGFIRSTIPRELEEAAKIDGASNIKIFFTIVFPLLKPVTASILIISCVYIWNDYQFAIFFLQADEVKTLTVALSSFFGQNSSRLNLVAAASIMAVIPMVILFLVLQKHFVKGLAAGSIKG
ncbi:carbohydrate ABC transporter permease [Bacillus sp. D386]|uniref:carbohydrate ABC transporter permease n=1 Tax=Bacillus sp. D386 TaxID=2587155 RepID=UPI00111D7B46|nr:carbohydrate ABC transporter permease [Bacillus sp. D386]